MPFIIASSEGSGFIWIGIVGVGELVRMGGEGFAGGLCRVVGGDIVGRLYVVDSIGCVVSDIAGEEESVWVSCNATDCEVSRVVDDIIGAFGLQPSSSVDINNTATKIRRFMFASDILVFPTC